MGNQEKSGGLKATKTHLTPLGLDEKNHTFMIVCGKGAKQEGKAKGRGDHSIHKDTAGTDWGKKGGWRKKKN